MLEQSQIDQFHRDGFIVLRGVFQGQELEDLRRAADKVQAEALANQGQNHLYYDQGKGQQTYYRSEHMWDRDPVFKAVSVKPELLRMIGQCIGHPFLPINDSFVCKVPRGDVPILWHQDPPESNPEYQHTFEIPNFDVDIYLDDSTIANGCVWGIPGHHLVGHIDLSKYSQEELFNNFGAVPMIMQPGDVLFHCLSSPHGSIGNTTDSYRRIFYVHYMAKEVLEHCYSREMNKGRGSYENRISFIQGMIKARDEMGWLAESQDDLEFSCHGFEYTGNIKTPPRHWGKLISELSSEEFQMKKNLEDSLVTV